MDRRNFIKISSILTAGSTVLTSCGKNLTQTLSQTIPDNEMVIGEERHVLSICGGCEAECGVEVRWIDGRAVKLEGQADHPVNHGRLCARGQAELQFLYNPDRVKSPLRGGQEITWDAALEELAAKLKGTDPAGIAFLTRRINGMRATAIDDFLAHIGAPPRVVVEPLGEASVRHAAVVQDFSNYNYVLSFGAPLVEGGPSPVMAQRTLAHMRQGRPGLRGKLVQVESRFSQTAAYADEWIYVHPGTEGALALAIGGSKAPEEAAVITGVSAEKIARLKREFAEHKPSVAVIGGAAAGHSNSASTADAVAALNDKAVAVAPAETARIRSLADIAGKPELQKLVLVAGCNPLYEAPGAIVSGATIVSFNSFPDETTEAAALVMPNHTTLEAAHGDDIKAAVVPLYQTRDTSVVLASVAGKLEAVKTKASAAAMPARAKSAWAPPTFQGSGDLYLHVYAGVALGTGDAANIPWLQELPDPMSQTVWTSALEMNPRTAAKFGLADGDAVVLQSTRGSAQARVAINPAAAPDIVAMAAGQGHTALGRYAKNRGANAYALIDPQLWAATKVTVRKA